MISIGLWRMNTVLPHSIQIQSLFPEKSRVGRNFIADNFLAMLINESRGGVPKARISGHAGSLKYSLCAGSSETGGIEMSTVYLHSDAKDLL
jgi:hypothetical protein